jgi:hypothetical protein
MYIVDVENILKWDEYDYRKVSSLPLYTTITWNNSNTEVNLTKCHTKVHVKLLIIN